MKLKNKPLPFVERLRNTNQQYAAFVKERREVLLSLDMPRIKAFLIKHGEEEATYCDEEPFLAGIHFAIIMDAGLTEQQKEPSYAWYNENGWTIVDGQPRKLPMSRQ